jgi:hypothetical protein
MTESPSADEPTTTPVASTATAAPPQQTYIERDREPRRSRLTAVAAWVGIVAGVVFIVAVIFFSGFILGAHAGGHRGHHGGGDRDMAFFHRGGRPPMFPMGPPRFERQPFGPGGPGFGPQQPSQPPTSAPSRP